MVIALFGYYKYGNFGDDLMAAMFAMALRNAQYRVRVYGLYPEFGESFGVERTESLEQLLDGAAVVVFGGGGLFLSDGSREFDVEIDELCNLAEKNGIPLILSSVGGNGSSLVELSDARARVLNAAVWATFRNEEDTELAVEAENTPNYAVHSDIVWSVKDYFSISPPVSDGRFAIGIDSSMSPKQTSWFVFGARTFARLFSRFFAVYELDQHLKFDNARAEGRRNVFCYDKDLGVFISGLTSCDLVITSRLHLGMTGVSAGGFVILLAPQKKAELVYRHLNLSQFVFTSRWEVLRFMWYLSNGRRYRTVFKRRITAHLPFLVKDSRKHVAGLLRQLSRYRH